MPDNSNITEYIDYDWSTLPSKSRICGVYVFDMVGTPYCKVGSTGMPMRRFREVSTYTPFDVVFPYFAAPTVHSDHIKIELEAQKLLDNFRHSGEWFECTAERAIVAIIEASATLNEASK